MASTLFEDGCWLPKRYKIQETLFFVGFCTTSNINYKSFFRHNKSKITYNNSCTRRKSHDMVIINKRMHKWFKSTRMSLHIR